MFNPGFGGGSGDFEGLARQYWSAWGQAMRQAGLDGGAAAPAPPSQWQQAVDWWSQLLPQAPGPANDAVSRFNRQARDWYGQMQQVAARFAGQDSNPADISKAWQAAIGADAFGGDNPLLDMFKRMRGPGAHGLDEWLEQVQPYVHSFQQHSQRWLHAPAFGQYREHQERWQALQLAQQEYQQRSAEYQQLMGTCMQQAFAVFEAKLAAHEEPGRQIASARGLFDLWIDAAEEAYARTALSLEFRQASGALTNAQMRLRAAIQVEVEQMTGLFGMPTRTEVDSAHRKIAELERALRRASTSTQRQPRPAPRSRAAAPASADVDVDEAVVAAAPSAPPAPRPRRAASARKPAVARTSARKPASKPVASAARSAGPHRASRKLATKPAQKHARAATKSKASKPKASKPKASKPKASTPKASTPKASTPKAASPGSAVKAAPAKPVASRPAAKPAVAARPLKPAAKTSKPASVAPSSSAQVVSMKDWVARYAAANAPKSPDAPKSKGGKKRAGK